MLEAGQQQTACRSLLISLLLLSSCTVGVCHAKRSNRTVTHTPVADVDILSSSIIPATCVMDDNRYAKQCRTIVFVELSSHGFARTSPALSFEILFRVFKYAGGGEKNPFGIGGQWERVIQGASVTSNTTHLQIVLAQNAGIVVYGVEKLVADFRAISTVVSDGVSIANSDVFPIQFTSNNDQYTPRDWARVTLALAAFLGAATTLIPVAPAVVDLQVAIMVGLSMCAHPNPHQLAVDARRILFPLNDDNSDDLSLLTRNFLFIITTVAAQLLFVMVVMLKRQTEFFRACASSFFPTLSFSVATFLQPGVAYASMKLVALSSSSFQWRLAGVGGLLYSVAFSFLPLVLLWIGAFKATSRSHNVALADFPLALRFCMPSSSWGPNVFVHPWLVPIGAMREKYLSLAGLSVWYPTLVACAVVNEPSKPSHCTFVVIAVGMVALAHAVVLIVFQPYRSKPMSVAAGVNSLLMLAIMATTIARCADANSLAGDAVPQAFFFVFLVSTLRAAASCVAFFLEFKIVRPCVWPDRKEERILSSVVGGGRSSCGGGQGAVLDAATLNLIQQYKEPGSSHVYFSSAKHDDAPRLGMPEPMTAQKSFVAPVVKSGRSAAQLRHPMSSVLQRDDGLIPPNTYETLSRGYQLL